MQPADSDGLRGYQRTMIKQLPYRLPEIVEAIATERGATSILRLVFFVLAHSVY